VWIKIRLKEEMPLSVELSGLPGASSMFLEAAGLRWYSTEVPSNHFLDGLTGTSVPEIPVAVCFIVEGVQVL